MKEWLWSSIRNEQFLFAQVEMERCQTAANAIRAAGVEPRRGEEAYTRSHIRVRGSFADEHHKRTD